MSFRPEFSKPQRRRNRAGTLSCNGKIGFADERNVQCEQLRARTDYRREMKYYKCKTCRCFHLTSD